LPGQPGNIDKGRENLHGEYAQRRIMTIKGTLCSLYNPYNQEIALTLYDKMGRFVYTTSIQPTNGSRQLIDFKKVIRTPGIYVIRIDTPQGMFTSKVGFL
jgi:hypothetical protein